MPELLSSSPYPPEHEHPPKTSGPPPNPIPDRPADKYVSLTTRESVDLFREAVDTARDDAKRKLSNDGAGVEVKPTFTVDLRNRHLSQLPKEVIAFIQYDVERLHLAHNQISQIAYEFTQCLALKYLNLKGNRFKEFPKAILGLPQIEILDLSRNKLNEIPDEIENIKALRVLSIQHNNIQDLPYCLGHINTLRMLKLNNNPLNSKLQRIMADAYADLPNHSPTVPYDEHERDILSTKKIIEHMRSSPDPKDSGEDSTSDGPMETPRALSRFPVQPQYGHHTSGSESASDLRSPMFSRPSMPSRSHTRVPSSQYNGLQNGGPRRPGLAPLALGNERNRSNSESILQSTQANKVKRMGVVRKRPTDLGILDETRANRNSTHFRGQSHGSALRNGVRAGDISPPESPGGSIYSQSTVIRRLASLPQEKSYSQSTDIIIEGAKGVLYSCHLIHPFVSTLAVLIGDTKPRKSSVERILSSAMLHIEHLDQDLSRFDPRLGQSTGFDQISRKAVAHAARECLIAHQEIVTILLRIAKSAVTKVDPRYLRTFIYTLSNSMHEIHIASKSMGVERSKSRPINSLQRVSTINEAPGEEEITYKSDRSVTPTQRRKPERRWGNPNNGQHSASHTNLPVLGLHTAGSSYSSSRSRSNSLARPMHSSTASSIVSTPRSGESFGMNFSVRSRSSSTNLTAEQIRVAKLEAAQFEQIFSLLRRVIDEGFSLIPMLQNDLLKSLERFDRRGGSKSISDHCNAFAGISNQCLELTEAMRIRLSMVRLNDREARNVPDFWQLGRGYLDCCSDVLSSLKVLMRQGILSLEWRQQGRPFHSLLKDASMLITSSQWEPLTRSIDPQMTPQAMPPPQTTYPLQNGYQHRSRGSGGSTAGGTSPYPNNVPATPLSAALGPAAQATVPSAAGGPQVTAPAPTPAAPIPATPSTASLERSFEGDIFQRADTYQQNFQQTIVPRRII